MKAKEAAIFTIALLPLGIGAALGETQEPARIPPYVLQRVVPQRPASEGAFSPDGQRFTFVHLDRLWLCERGVVRRIGAPAVDRVYRARWADTDVIVVSQVVPGFGDVLGVLDLKAGKYREIARRVDEYGFDTSRKGGLVTWRVGAPWRRLPEAWGLLAKQEQRSAVRIGSGQSAGVAVPSPDGQRVASISHEGQPCLYQVGPSQTQMLQLEPPLVPVAAAWSPDSHRVAYLAVSREPSLGSGATPEPRLFTAPCVQNAVCFYDPTGAVPVRLQPLPSRCTRIAWDAEGAGVLCQMDGDDPGLWRVPLAPLEPPRRLYSGRVVQFVPLAGQYTLLAVPAGERAGLRHLALVDGGGTLVRRLTHLAGVDTLDDVSVDHRRVLLTRRPRDDRESLLSAATLWTFEWLGR